MANGGLGRGANIGWTEERGRSACHVRRALWRGLLTVNEACSGPARDSARIGTGIKHRKRNIHTCRTGRQYMFCSGSWRVETCTCHCQCADGSRIHFARTSHPSQIRTCHLAQSQSQPNSSQIQIWGRRWLLCPDPPRSVPPLPACPCRRNPLGTALILPSRGLIGSCAGEMVGRRPAVETMTDF